MTQNKYVPMKHRKGYATAQQTIQIIKHFNQKSQKAKTPKASTAWQRMALLIFTLWRSGRRITEIVGLYGNYQRVPGLRPIDIDHENNEIDWSILKKLPVRSKTRNGQPRKPQAIKKDRENKEKYIETIPYPEDFVQALWSWCKQNNLSPYERIFPYRREYVDRVLKTACRELNISIRGRKIIKNKNTQLQEVMPYQLGAHSFRHGFSINFLQKNKNDPSALVVLQEILVHSNINVTKEYLRFDDTKHRELLQKAS